MCSPVLDVILHNSLGIHVNLARFNNEHDNSTRKTKSMHSIVEQEIFVWLFDIRRLNPLSSTV